MKKLLLAVAAAGLVVVAMAATAVAAGPDGPAGVGDAIVDVLRLSRDEVRDLRHDGLSLAEIAERQDVDPDALVDALMARWTERIQARVEAGALTPDEATQLQAQLEVRAREMVEQGEPGGMRGAAVGAGFGRMSGAAGAGPGQYGDGTCDGTGPHGPGGR
ncbi:MAG: hypothetical protein FIA92_09625 [Chloroflexi bacterium]|nr:hypothetical protein [Chloroflexota bacterium]